MTGKHYVQFQNWVVLLLTFGYNTIVLIGNRLQTIKPIRNITSKYWIKINFRQLNNLMGITISVLNDVLHHVFYATAYKYGRI